MIRAYRFTNAYRASDRVSQYLIRHVIDEGMTDEDIFFRTIVFKIFNSIETWSLLEDRLGGVRWSAFRFSDYDRVLSQAFEAGKRVYSGAYIMPSVAKFKCARKHSAHLKLVAEMMATGMPVRVRASRTMSEVYQALLAFPGIGPFLAYQYSIDLNYGPLSTFPESAPMPVDQSSGVSVVHGSGPPAGAVVGPPGAGRRGSEVGISMDGLERWC